MTAHPFRIALVGYGKIAIDQHIPAIRANPDFELAAVVSARGEGPQGVPIFRTIDDLPILNLGITAATHCNTPRARLDTALATIGWPLHTMLEKPPTATLTEWQLVEAATQPHQTCTMTAWHSRANEAVLAAMSWLGDKSIKRMHIDWHEDVRKWHPGQDWIWDAGGFGVFDPGINALSIITAILPFTPYVTRARLFIPSNRPMPIAAELDFAARGWGGRMTASFDWRTTGDERWRITIDTDAGQMVLDEGGRHLLVDGQTLLRHGDAEYPALYAEFARLITGTRKLLDAAPLRLVADAFLLGQRHSVAPFE
jgi:D-galactose 1-dehydrogenase